MANLNEKVAQFTVEVIHNFMDSQNMISPDETFICLEIKCDSTSRTYDAVLMTDSGSVYRLGAERDYNHKELADLYAVLDAYVAITSTRLVQLSDDFFVPRISSLVNAQAILRSIFTDPGKHRCDVSLEQVHYGPFAHHKFNVHYLGGEFNWESLCENVHPSVVSELESYLTSAITEQGILTFLF